LFAVNSVLDESESALFSLCRDLITSATDFHHLDNCLQNRFLSTEKMAPKMAQKKWRQKMAPKYGAEKMAQKKLRQNMAQKKWRQYSQYVHICSG
jgi:hypothetical protein